MTTVATRTDRYGLPISTDSDAAAAAYREGQERVLAFGVEPGEWFERAIAADPLFALAHAALANVRLREQRLAEAREISLTAERLAAGHADAREHAHIAVVVDAAHGRGPQALARIREHLAVHPRDALVLNNGVTSLLFGGMQEQMAALTSSVEHAYPERDPFFLGLHAFALEEARQFVPARAAAEAALAGYPLAAFAAHALAHVFYEQGAFDDGVGFAPGWLERYDRAAGLHLHMSWHLALFLLARGEYGRVFALYETHIRPPANPPGSYHLYDPVSLLWRTDAFGAAKQDALWEQLGAEAEVRSAQPGMVFADLHHGMALAASGRRAALDGVCASLAARGERGNAIAGEVALPLLRGMAAFADGDYEATVRQIGPVEDRIYLVGGSKAQREVFHDTLLEALLRSGRYEAAEARLHAKLDCRAAPRDFFRAAVAKVSAGESSAAREHARTARAGWAGLDGDAPERGALEHLAM